MIRDRNLHIVGRQAEYLLTTPEKRNAAQRLAVRTHGIITPGNIVSLVGFGLVVSGLHDIYEGDLKKGTKKVLAGRACDLFDGAVAHLTKTKSPLGEATDTIIDKLELTIATAILKRKGYMPDGAFNTIVGREAVMYALTGIAKYRGAESHPNEASKRYTFVEWAGIVGGYLPSGAAAELDQPVVSDIFKFAGNVLLAAHTKAGVEGIQELARQAFAPVAA